jgi:hypothetical protein
MVSGNRGRFDGANQGKETVMFPFENKTHGKGIYNEVIMGEKQGSPNLH